MGTGFSHGLDGYELIQKLHRQEREWRHKLPQDVVFEFFARRAPDLWQQSGLDLSVTINCQQSLLFLHPHESLHPVLLRLRELVGAKSVLGWCDRSLNGKGSRDL